MDIPNKENLEDNTDSEYNRLARYHLLYCDHGRESFLAWHRGYLAEYEWALQDSDKDLGGDGNVFLPYWEWDNT